MIDITDIKIGSYIHVKEGNNLTIAKIHLINSYGCFVKYPDRHEFKLFGQIFGIPCTDENLCKFCFESNKMQIGDYNIEYDSHTRLLTITNKITTKIYVEFIHTLQIIIHIVTNEWLYMQEV